MSSSLGTGERSSGGVVAMVASKGLASG